MAPARKSRSCETCGKEFTKPDHLLRHMRSHNNEKPFTCKICDKAFGRQDVLTRHIRGHERKAATLREPQPGASGIPAWKYALDAWNIVNSDAQQQQGDPDVPQDEEEEPHSFAIDPQFGVPTAPAVLHSPDYTATMPTLDARFWADLDVNWDIRAVGLLASRKPADAHSTVEQDADPVAALWSRFGAAQSATPEPPFADGASLWQATYFHLTADVDFVPLVPPTAAFVETAIEQYFHSLDGGYPFLHRPTFLARQQHPLIVLAVAATGARFLGTEEGERFAAQIFGRIAVYLQRYWNDDQVSQLDLLRVALLLQNYCLASGQKELVQSGVVLQRAIVTHAHRLGYTSGGGPCYPVLPEPQALAGSDGADLDLAWREWVKAEEARRVVSVIYETETYLHSQAAGVVAPHLAPATTQTSVMPSSGDLFHAPTAATWSNIAVVQPDASQRPLADYVGDHFAGADMPIIVSGGGGAQTLSTAKLILDGIYQQNRVLALTQLLGAPLKGPATLIALDRWRKITMPHGQQDDMATDSWRRRELDMAWHSLVIDELIPIDVLYAANGRDGKAAISDALGKLLLLHSTSLARRALLHAAQLLQAFGTETSIAYPGHITLSLAFKAALVFITLPELDPTSSDPVFSLSDAVEWDRLGVAGVSAPSDIDIMFNPAAKFVERGGPWSFRGADSPKAVLEWTAMRLEELSKGSLIPVGGVLATILRERVEAT